MSIVYLAESTLFLPNAAEVFDTMKPILAGYDLKRAAPVDNQIPASSS